MASSHLITKEEAGVQSADLPVFMGAKRGFQVREADQYPRKTWVASREWTVITAVISVICISN